MFSIFNRKTTQKFPEKILVRSPDSKNDEIAEEWARKCEPHLLDMFGVYACTFKDESEDGSPWHVLFGAGEYIQEAPWAGLLNEAILQAILSVEDVTDAHLEDETKYIVSGQPLGHALVYAVCEAIDAFAHEHIDDWADHCRALEE